MDQLTDWSGVTCVLVRPTRAKVSPRYCCTSWTRDAVYLLIGLLQSLSLPLSPSCVVILFHQHAALTGSVCFPNPPQLHSDGCKFMCMQILLVSNACIYCCRSFWADDDNIYGNCRGRDPHCNLIFSNDLITISSGEFASLSSGSVVR